MEDGMLKIINLTKHYKGKTAVDGLNLHVETGDVYGFIGHNGAGKTTTIKSCAGILDFDEGEILIDGISIKKDPLGCKRRLAYIPDNPDLYEFMTGIKYLNFICDIYAVPLGEREEKIPYYADLFAIKDDLNMKLGGYSHGMKQKIALISAFVHNPSLIIMDEPFVGLDPVSSYALKKLMREFCAGGGAVFFSTHVLEVAQKLCSKIAVIKDGKLIASGLTEDVVGDSSLEDVFMSLVTRSDD